jgi:hypothetical protein
MCDLTESIKGTALPWADYCMIPTALAYRMKILDIYSAIDISLIHAGWSMGNIMAPSWHNQCDRISFELRVDIVTISAGVTYTSGTNHARSMRCPAPLEPGWKT